MERIPEFVGNHLFLVTLFIAILILLIWNLYGSAVTGIKQITPAEMTRLMNHENALVIDVRIEDDFKSGHILNAKNLPDTEIQSHQKELEKYRSKPFITYCSNGAISTRVARSFKTDGFEQVYCLKGGVLAWQGANLPLTKDGS